MEGQPAEHGVALHPLCGLACTSVSVPGHVDSQSYILTASSGVQIILSSRLPPGEEGGVGMTAAFTLCFVHWRGSDFWPLVSENRTEWLGSRGHSPELADIPARGTPSVCILILTIPHGGLTPQRPLCFEWGCGP